MCTGDNARTLGAAAARPERTARIRKRARQRGGLGVARLQVAPQCLQFRLRPRQPPAQLLLHAREVPSTKVASVTVLHMAWQHMVSLSSPHRPPVQLLLQVAVPQSWLKRPSVCGLRDAPAASLASAQCCAKDEVAINSAVHTYAAFITQTECMRGAHLQRLLTLHGRRPEPGQARPLVPDFPSSYSSIARGARLERLVELGLRGGRPESGQARGQVLLLPRQLLRLQGRHLNLRAHASRALTQPAAVFVAKCLRPYAR